MAWKIVQPEAAQQQPQAQEQQNPIMQGVDIFNNAFGKYVAPIGAGALQFGGDTLASLGNLLIDKKIPMLDEQGKPYLSSPKIPHPDLKKYLKKGAATDVGFLGGQIGGGLLAGGGFGGQALRQNLNQLGRPGGLRGLATDALNYGASGYALGEDAEGNRGIGAALGAVIGPAQSLIGGQITKRILGDKAKFEQKFGELYSGLFDTAKGLGAGLVRQKPSRQMTSQELRKHVNEIRRVKKELLKPIPNEFGDSYRDFLKNPTLDNAHSAQSDLGKFIRWFDSKRTTETPNSQIGAYDRAVKERNKLKKEISATLNQVSPALGEEYKALTAGYKQEVVPYLKSHSIHDAISGELDPALLHKDLMNRSNYKFRKDLGARYPELGMNARLTSPTAKGLGLALAAALGFPTAYNKFRENQ